MRAGRAPAVAALPMLLALAVLAPTGPAEAATDQWHVAPGGSDLDDGSATSPFATVQRAIAAADSGDVVLLAAGIYQGDGNRLIDFQGKAITVRSAGGLADSCIIDAEGFDGIVFRSGENEGSLLADVTIVGAARGIVVEGCAPLLSGCATDSCATGLDVSGIGARADVADCRFQNGTTGVLIRDNATSGVIKRTRCAGNTGAGIRTTGQWTVYGTLGLWISECELVDNQGHGLSHEARFGGANVVDCEVAGNGGWGLHSEANQDRGLRVRGGAVHDNGAGGIDTFASNFDGVTDCKIYSNRGHGILTSWDAMHTVANCDIHDNTGHGISLGDGPLPAAKDGEREAILDCRIADNGGCGIDLAFASYGDHLVAGCLIEGNAGPGLRVTASYNPNAQQRLLIRESTFVGNSHGVQIASDFPVEMEHVVVAFNLGAAVDCTVTPTVAVACSDLFGNPGGDWTGPIAPAAGLDGNLSADPLFCDAPAGDYALLDLSPCAPDPTDACGRIGARDVGCQAAPQLLTLTDVGGDQGGQLRLRWSASHFDRPGQVQPVTAYGVYRRQDQAKVGGGAPGTDKAGTRADKLLDWDFVAMIPSRGDEGYQYVAPTLVDAPAPGDSTGAWSVFMVSAMTADPFTFHDSAPDSGVSLDNLAPATPPALTLASGRILSWQLCHDADLAGYAVYGSATGALDGTEVALGETTATTFDVAAHIHPYFLVSAVDRHANGSEPAVWAVVAGAADTALPGALALRPCFPNPFNPSTTLGFALPAGGPVRLAVYDVAGRLVRTLIDATLDPGPHETRWDGRDDRGQGVGAGAYLAKLESGGERRTIRLTLLK